MKQEIQDAVKLAITKDDLILRTEALVKNEGFRYSEALIHICDKLELEIDEVAKMVTGPLRDKLKNEAMTHNILPKSNTVSLI